MNYFALFVLCSLASFCSAQLSSPLGAYGCRVGGQFDCSVSSLAFETAPPTAMDLNFNSLDDSTQDFMLPFSFSYFGTPIANLTLSTNGLVYPTGFGNPPGFDGCCEGITQPVGLNGGSSNFSSFWAFSWTDLVFSSNQTLITWTAGSMATNDLRQIFSISQVNFFSTPDTMTVQLKFFQSNRVEFHYQSMSFANNNGDRIAIGVAGSLTDFANSLLATPRANTTFIAPFSFRYDAWSCGNGIVTSNEACDDANSVSMDGCSNCLVDSGYACTGQPSVCSILTSATSASNYGASTSSAVTLAVSSLYIVFSLFFA